MTGKPTGARKPKRRPAPMSAADVLATALDLTSGETAAVSFSDFMLAVARRVEEGLAAEHDEEQAALFHSVFLARYMGFVTARFGPEGAHALLDANRLALCALAPSLEREMAARRGKVH